jgi:hypothetical protein
VGARSQINARIPMATPDELRMAQIEKEKADQRFWKIVQEAHKEQTEGHEKMAVTARAIAADGRAMAAKAEARVARADDRIACLERGEALSEEVGKSAEYASAIRAFSSHEEHETRRVTRLRRKRGRPKEKKHRRLYWSPCISCETITNDVSRSVASPERFTKQSISNRNIAIPEDTKAISRPRRSKRIFAWGARSMMNR